MGDTDTAANVMDFSALEATLAQAKGDSGLFAAIVNAPFEQPVAAAFLFLGITVLLHVNKRTGMIDRVALSNTELAKNTTDVSYLPFEAIKIPLNNPQNIIAESIRSGATQDTTDWKYLFTPALSAKQARVNQASGGIAYSAVYPLKSRNGGAMIFSYFQYMEQIGEAQQTFMEKYSRLVDKLLEAKN